LPKGESTHKDTSSGAAWLSSARTLKRTLKCGNERNPYRLFYLSDETAWDNQEEGEDDAKSAWPFDALGCTRGTMGPTMGCEVVTRS
jgi:nitrous oxide reductase accessory protein NosL